MRTGDRVLIEAWTIDSGNRIEEYEITHLSGDTISLKHMFTHRKTGDKLDRIPGTGRVTEHGARMIEHLSTPFAERWEQHLQDMRWLCEKLAGK